MSNAQDRIEITGFATLEAAYERFEREDPEAVALMVRINGKHAGEYHLSVHRQAGYSEEYNGWITHLLVAPDGDTFPGFPGITLATIDAALIFGIRVAIEHARTGRPRTAEQMLEYAQEGPRSRRQPTAHP